MSRRVWFAATAAAGLVTLAATAAPAGADATCEGYKDVANHGEHVITDYVVGAVVNGQEPKAWPPAGGLGEIVSANGGAAVPGGPGPGFHFTVGAPPGASFCNPQARSGDR